MGVGVADYDLTGQLVWPGSGILNDYLVNHSHRLDGLSVIELGSGVGKKSPMVSYIIFLERFKHQCFFFLFVVPSDNNGIRHCLL